MLPLKNFFGNTSGMVPVLEAAPFRGPVDKPLQVFAVFPGEMEKLARRQVGRFLSKKRLKPPAYVRTLPRLQAITARGVPIVAQRLKHSLALRPCGRALANSPIDPGTEACRKDAQRRAAYHRAICPAWQAIFLAC